MSQVRWSPVRTVKQISMLLTQILSLPYYFVENPVKFNNILNSLEKRLGRTRLLSYPPYFGVNISNVCDQKCVFCYHDNDKMVTKNWLDENLFRRMKWLRYVERIDMFANLGEPLLNPHFPEIVREIKLLAPRSHLGIFTNGLNLHGKNMDAVVEHLDTLHISLNAATEPVYNAVIEGGDYRKVMKNLNELSLRRPDSLHVELSMVLIKSNVGDIKNMVKLASRLRFNRVIVAYANFFLLPNTVNQNESAKGIVIEKGLKEYAEKLGIDFLFPQIRLPDNPCLLPWSTAYIFNDSVGRPTLGICCPAMALNTYLKPSMYANFKKAWNSKRLQNIRKTVNLPRELQNNLCFVCKQLDQSDPDWKNKMRAITKNRDEYSFPSEDLPTAFEYELIG